MGFPLVSRMRGSFSVRPALFSRALPMILGFTDVSNRRCGDLRDLLTEPDMQGVLRWVYGNVHDSILLVIRTPHLHSKYIGETEIEPERLIKVFIVEFYNGI